jgi:hypothetical protein
MSENKDAIQNIAFCPHCGNTTPQKLVFTHSYQGVGYDSGTGAKDEYGPPCEYYIATCSTCNDLLLYHNFIDQTDQENFSEATLVHPSNQQLPNSVPGTIRQAYAEAARIQNIAPNAYAVMIRRALEAVCDDRKVQNGSLQRRLAILVERGELPATLAEMTTMLRTLGNAGAHYTVKAVTVPMTWGMNEFFRAIIEYVYVAPNKIEEFRKRLNQPSSDKVKKENEDVDE